MDLEAVRRRFELAAMAGRDATEAGNGWNPAKIAAVVSSWQDVASLHDGVKRQRVELDRQIAEAEARGRRLQHADDVAALRDEARWDEWQYRTAWRNRVVRDLDRFTAADFLASLAPTDGSTDD